MQPNKHVEEGRKSLRFVLISFLLLSGSFILVFVYGFMGDIGFNQLSRVVAVVCVALALTAGCFAVRSLARRKRTQTNPFGGSFNIERQSLVGGVVCFLLGLAALCVGCALLFLGDDDWSAWIASFFMILFGLFFATAGALGMIIQPTIRRWKRKRILSLGISVTAKVTELRKKNDDSPYWIIEAEVADKRLGDDGIFVSHAFGNDPRTNRSWQNPKKDYPIGNVITVRYLPEDPLTYAFDLVDRLDGPRQPRKPMSVAVREAWIRDNIDKICTNSLSDAPDVSWTINGILHRDKFTIVEAEAPLPPELGCSSFKVVLRCEAETDPEVEGAYGLTGTRWILLFGEESEWAAV